MKVELARTAGFCMGVTRAMEMALEAARSGLRPLYTLGPLIHNRQAVSALEAEGIRIAEDPEEVPPGAGVIIRAHGVRPEVRRALESRGARIIDATCPHVLASQRRIAEQSAAGASVIIVGDRDHAEIRGLVGHARGPVAVVGSVDELAATALPPPLCIIAQTTFSESTYGAIVAEARRRFPGITVFESICSSTEDRQREIRDLSERVNAVVVVGGRHSANTLRLAELARFSGKPVVHVESAAELDLSALAGVRLVGVTAGASTPSWVIGEVVDKLAASEAP
ncbi:MAG TPA: 4-hydroxy-3-methylbut-2-enyl diphosphate reductase [Planctomycetota bacterium]|nr:4-hydroxy-3-methylbut-2-enyl diphosphate reductase [Planctomycetota bacterium]